MYNTIIVVCVIQLNHKLVIAFSDAYLDMLQ